MNQRILLVVLWIVGVAAPTGCAPWQRADETGKPFTLVVLPDTQCYCDTRLASSAKRWGNGDLREYFFTQTRWIREHTADLNIVFAVHEGDITQTDYDEEWAIAQKAMSTLDGVVPYCLCLGNHDIGYRGGKKPGEYTTAVDRTTLFNKYFPRSRYAGLPWFGGTHDDSHDNSYYIFEQSGMRFLILALEFKPRDKVIEWANSVVSEHPESRVIVLTHSYLDAQNKRVAAGYDVAGNHGEQMWQKLVSQHENIFMVLCGHRLGEGRLASAGKHGNTVHELLCDYQGLNDGGESWLRYMTFHPLENRIEVHTYNPALDTSKTGPSSRFTLRYPMLGPGPTARETGPVTSAAHHRSE